MKKEIIIIFTLFLYASIGFAQEKKISIKRASENIQNILNTNINDSLPQIYITDINTIDSLIRLSGKKYKIIYFFSSKCHSSIESFPKLIEVINENNAKVDLFPVSGNKYSEVPNITNYLKRQHYFKPIYILDTDKYGNKSNPFKRIDILTQKLCKECEFKKMGFSSFFVLDNNNNIVLHNTWEVIGLRKIEQLKELLKE